MKNKCIVVIICLIMILVSSVGYCERFIGEGNHPKTVIIILDELDFSVAKNLIDDNLGVGIINNRTASLYRGDNKESYFFTIATGRRIKLKEPLFKGINEKGREGLEMENYDKILTKLTEYNTILKRNNLMFGEYFNKKGIHVGYMGEGIASILASDDNGLIEYGYKDVRYNAILLKEATEKLFENIDILIVDFSGQKQQSIYELKEYIKSLRENHILLISPNIPKGMSRKFNDKLGVMIYSSPNSNGGVLSSISTKRRGIVTNLDIFPHVASVYGLEGEDFIGNEIEVHSKDNPVKTIERNFNQYLNLNIIKYIFHFLIILGQIYIIYLIAIRKSEIWKLNDRCEIIINSIIASLVLSLILGVVGFQNTNYIFYSFTIITLSILTSYIFKKKHKKAFPILVGVLNLTILYSILFNYDIIYNSYIGYNNIVAGGRFYGMNNGMLGVFLGSGISFYFRLRNRLKNNIFKRLTMMIFPVMIVTLSGSFGANTGGFITAIALFMIVIYYEFLFEFNQKKSRKSKVTIVAILGVLGTLVMGITFYIDTINEASHVGSMINRTISFGYIEVLDLLIKKIKQLLFMIVVPPWSIILIGQMYFMYKVYKLYSDKGNIKTENIEVEKVKEKIQKNNIEKLKGDIYIDASIRGEIYIIFITSVIGLLINDTGVIAFTYMNTFILGRVISLHNIEKRYLY